MKSLTGRICCVFVWVFAAFVPCLAGAANLDTWRIEIGPAGNEYSKRAPKDAKEEGLEPTEAVLRWPKQIAPDVPVTLAGKFGEVASDYYVLIAEDDEDLYWYLVTRDADLARLAYHNKKDLTMEEPGGTVPKGGKRAIALEQVPKAMIEALVALLPESNPSEAWYADTLLGPRYIVKVDTTFFYGTPGGRIRCAAVEKMGGGNEVPPDTTLGPLSMEALEGALGKYRDRFNFERQIARLQASSEGTEKGFRFVVMGDSRSNKELWEAIIAHITTLEPKPAFVINTGDIVPHGFVDEYAEYYVPPFADTDMPVFVAIGNHDMGQGGKAGEFKYLFGESSLNYYFDYGRCRFVLLDNCTDTVSWSAILEQADRWLSETPAGFTKFVACHEPPANIEMWAYHAMDAAKSKPFTDLMAKHRVEDVFLGHIHAYSTATLDGVRYSITGGGGAELHRGYGPKGSVHHYVICDVTPDGVKQQVVRFRPRKKN